MSEEKISYKKTKSCDNWKGEYGKIPLPKKDSTSKDYRI
jgi:hypothetical protein